MSIADSLVSQSEHHGPEIHHPTFAKSIGEIDNVQIALEQAYALLHGEEAVPRERVIENLRHALTERRGEEWMAGFHAAVAT